jgi:N-acetyl-gamma-glutamyl-phosphate reductase
MGEAQTYTVGLVGARGYTGKELLALIAAHPNLELAYAGSRRLVGQPVEGHGVDYERLGPEDVLAREVDVCVLALPNRVSPEFVDALEASGSALRVLDLSADWRFDGGWAYGWPERRRAEISGARRVANPGCYATGMQAALWPVRALIEGTPVVFGVSGYSGAGTNPSPRNDVDALRDNLMPYSLNGHGHEREVSHQLGRAVRFMPHVAPWFRGITLTVSFRASEPVTREQIQSIYAEAWSGEPLVEVQQDAPLVRDAVGRHVVTVGGVSVGEGGREVAVVVTLDNLLKGAATQAMQNINLMLGLPELAGVE